MYPLLDMFPCEIDIPEEGLSIEEWNWLRNTPKKRKNSGETSRPEEILIGMYMEVPL